MLNRFLVLQQRGRYVVFAIVAIAIFGFGINQAVVTTRLVTDGDHVTGHVVDSLRSKMDGDYRYRAVIGYEIDGTERQLTTSKELDEEPPHGEARQLLVNPDDPDDARADSFGELWLSTIVLFTFGVLLVLALAYRLLGGRAWLRRRRERRGR